MTELHGPQPITIDAVRRFWRLAGDVHFLNHGSFGACPQPVLEVQADWRARMERQPVQFFARDLEPLLDDARAALAAFVGVAPKDLAWVPNATAGVNAVLRSLTLARGDELLTTDHEYNACANALRYVADRSGAKVTVAHLPRPLEGPQSVVDAIEAALTPQTRLLLIDHVTSQTGIVMPIAALAERMRERGVRVLVDGAHAPGMLDLDITALEVDYYTGNCHKWLCAPKGAGFLWVRPPLQREVRPVAISHGANARRPRSRFLMEFDWVGTDDPTAVLSVPAALDFMGGLLPGGWPALRAHNRALCLAGRRLLIDTLGGEPIAPEQMIGAIASHPLPPGADAGPPQSSLYADPLQDTLLEDHRIEVPVVPWPAPPQRLVRISAQLYNDIDQYRLLARALAALLAGEDGPARGVR
jgi:isopenicillin-N epimerase